MEQMKKYERLEELARSYVPEWHFTAENPDVGSVLAILVDDMLTQSSDRLFRALHKHRIQYLNLFDRLKEEPVEAARSYARFHQVSGMQEPVPVPKGTRLFAEEEHNGIRLAFETEHGITTTAATLKSVCVTDGESDRIARLYDGGEGGCHFEAFGLSDTNEAEHLLLLGYDTAFDALDGLSLGLRVRVSGERKPDEALALLASAQVRYSMLEQEGERPFDSVQLSDGMIQLELRDYIPQQVELAGKNRYVLCIRASEPLDLRITSCELMLSQDGIPADEVFCGGVSQSVGRFLPFGSPMEIFAECGIECRRAFARRGAGIEISFDLGFEVLEQRLPETENELDLRIIMKRPVEPPKLETAEVRADYVLIEYLGERGWKRLLSDEHAALLMNGSAEGTVTLRFLCPADMAREPGEGGRLRMRLMRADNLYRLPCRQYSPVIRNLRFSYSYDAAGLCADYACTRNNFSEQEVTGRLDSGKEVVPFYSNETGKRAMYLGFDQNPKGMPLSLYFEVENDIDCPLDYTAEVLTSRGFEPLTASDNTGGMLYSGTLLLPVSGDAAPSHLFGRELWWLRLRLRGELPASLPVVRGILTNMARVRNLRSMSETFYRTEENAPLRITLAERSLLNVRIFVNEEDGDPSHEENWVEWRRRTALSQQGRFCEVDLAAGTVEFGRNDFAAYPLKEGAAAVRVDYQSYQGALANVPEGSITALAESLRYISGVTNPMPAYGGYDGYNERTGAAMISNILRTRGRAVTGRDYFDIVSQVSYGVRRIKCLSGVDRLGRRAEDTVTVALLIDEYDKGGHIFSSVKDTVRRKLMESGSLIPMGKTLVLCQPCFVRFSARLWLECPSLDGAYDLQRAVEEEISAFLDPLAGGFDGNGWEIGVLPTVRQLLAWLKMRRPGLVVTRVAMSARHQEREYTVDEELPSLIGNPFAMAVNGEHTVYVRSTATAEAPQR
ncbi:putative baseplate assembly protein [Eubacteriales bacterium]|mgnify:FL=1|nr:hypothetical protein [Faecalicatena sp. BF-R-105]GKH50574.1 putative baseplate assembly protein [Eubacteriales bacterium]GKH63296.1 putative baseplate assembly protein [Eubacteriales bacterium]